MTTCPYCGFEVEGEDTRFCDTCGNRTVPASLSGFEFSVSLPANRLVQYLDGQPLWDRDLFRDDHQRSYIVKSEPGWDDVESLFLFDKAIDASEAKKPLEAIPILEQILKRRPGYAEAYLQIACDYCNMGEWKGCLDALERMQRSVADRNREVPNVHYFFGTAYEGLGEVDRAIVEGQKELVVAGPNENTLLMLTGLYDRKIQSDATSVSGSSAGVLLECWVACFGRLLKMNPTEEFANAFRQRCQFLQKGIPRQRLQQLSGLSAEEFIRTVPVPSPYKCRACGGPLDMRDAPLDLSLGLKDNLYVAICIRCVERMDCQIETHPVQDRTWIKGQKFLRYGDFFVNY